MTWYVLRRVLQMIPVFFGATFLVYFLVFFMPGDPIAALGGDKPLPEAAQIRLREEFNLDKPFLVQYFLYLANIFQGDLGDRKSTRLNSSHVAISYAVFCLKKKKKSTTG